MSKRILALDAAGMVCSAALVEDGACLAERSGGDSRTATAGLPRMVRDLLAAHGGGFDAVAVTVGPGSFTGLRGALALAHGLALGAGVPVIGVRVAEALRHGAAPGPVWVALDSRRAGRVFLDTGDGMAARALDALPAPPGPVVVIGDAAEAVCALLPGAAPGAPRRVSASDVAAVAVRRMAGEIGPCEPQPAYLEPPAVSEA